jgi:Fe-S cluster biogenesis protein NfuA
VAEEDWRAAGDRIDALLAASASAGAAARERAEELVRLVVDLYGAGLERLLQVLHEHGQLSDDALDALAGDPLVASLLLVHGLHPYSVERRVVEALQSLKADAELIGVDEDGTVHLRLSGGNGCGAAAAEQRIEDAVAAVAPEITAISFSEAPVIPVASLFARVGHAPVAP